MLALLLAACRFNTDTKGLAGDADPNAPDADPSVIDADPGAPDADYDAMSSADATPALCFEPSREVDVSLNIIAAPACATWNSLNSLPGPTVITRSGDVIMIDFGDGVVLTGTVSGMMVTLTYAHQHPFSDNCTWEAVESLSGTLSEGDCVLDLSYTYGESVVASDGNCASPCPASGDVNLSISPIVVD